MIPAFAILFISSFVLASTGPDAKIISHLFMFSTCALGIVQMFRGNKEIKIPPGFFWISVFTAVTLIYPLFVVDKTAPLFYGISFAEGLALWLVFYNLRENRDRIAGYLILSPLIFYSLLYLLDKILNLNLTDISKYFFSKDPKYPHQFIGDFWAVGIAYLISEAKISKYIKRLLIICGIYFLFISDSRTAFLAAFLAIVYVNRSALKTKKLLYGLIFCLVSVFFVLKATLAPTILSRPYFAQSILSIPKNIFGVGMGNFRTISEAYYYSKGPFSAFSEYTHNIFLEVISGVGIFAIPFFVWAYIVFKKVLSEEKTPNPFSAAFLTISILMFFTQIYIIPGIFWLWFIALGASKS